MGTISYISSVAENLIKKYDTRDPYELCEQLDIKVRYKDLGEYITAFFFYQSRIKSIVLNNRLSEDFCRVLAAHELGHAILHKSIAMAHGFNETEIFTSTLVTECEANLFAADLLIDDDSLKSTLKNYNSIGEVSRELGFHPMLVGFKLKILKEKGYKIKIPHINNGDFLKYMNEKDYNM